MSAGAVDGCHPQQFSLLSLVGLYALTVLYEAVEGLGLAPRALSFAVVQLLPKPKGGLRPICMCAASVRLWERACRVELQCWRAQWGRPYWAFTEGRGVELTVWRQQVRTERALYDC